ncbi:MAG: erythromycin esterase family protein [Acidobacteriota bacterium]
MRRILLVLAFVLSGASAGASTAVEVPPQSIDPKATDGGAPLASCVPLRSVESGSLPRDDLAALARWLQGSRVVGLGESPHGTSTLHKLWNRLVMDLGAQLRIDIVALEVDLAHAALLDAYVQGEEDDLHALLGRRWWASEIFFDEDLVELLRWMRRVNATGERRLQFAGFDVKQPALAAELLLDALAVRGEADVGRARRWIEAALAPGGFGVVPNLAGYTADLELMLPTIDRPRRLRLELPMRGDGVEVGSVGLLAGTGAPWRRQEIRAPLESLGHGWVATFEIDLQPGDGEQFGLSLFHRGDGAAFFGSPRVTLDGVAVGPSDTLGSLERWPLQFPQLQVDDYESARVELPNDSFFSSASALRVAQDPKFKRSRRAANDLVSWIDRIAGASDSMDGSLLRRLARAIEQAVAWRTLAEPHRDAFLAENLVWLTEHGGLASHGETSPTNVLVLAHRSHTERIAGRMGDRLAARYGSDYRAVTLIAGSGSARNLRSVGDSAVLEVVEIPARPRPAAACGSDIAGAGVLVDLQDPLTHHATSRPSSAHQLEGDRAQTETTRDVMIYVDAVESMRPLGGDGPW